MVVLLFYGYCNPYKDRITNVLEVCLLSLLLMLLMFWDNLYFRDWISVIDYDHTTISQCDNHFHIETMFAAVLTCFYYGPLVVGLCCLLTMIVITL